MGRDVLIEASLIRHRGVPGRQIEQTALLAALGNQQPDSVPGSARKPAFEHLGVGVAEAGRQVDLRRRGPVGVELLQRRLQHVALATVALWRRTRARIQRLAQLRGQLDPLDHPSPTHLEDLHHRPGRPELQPERVAVAELDPGHLLMPRVLGFDRPDRVAQLRRLLEALVGRRLDHPLTQPLDQLVAPSFEEQLRVSHRDPILLFRAQFTDARRDTPLDVVLQARPAAFARNHLVARPHPKQPMRQRHRSPRQLGWQEWTGVVVLVPLRLPRDQDAGKCLAGGQLQVGVVLVVAQEDVVAGILLLDQVVLERQRLDHRVGDDGLEPCRLVEERVDARAHALRAEVAAHPVPEHARLADVQGFTRLVRVDVDPGLFGKTGYLGLEITDWHALHCEFWRRSEPFIIARGIRDS